MISHRLFAERKKADAARRKKRLPHLPSLGSDWGLVTGNFTQTEQAPGEGPRQRRRMDVPRSGTLLRSGKHAICSRRSTVYSTFPVSHSAEFCLFEAAHPLPFGHPLLQGGTRFTFISKLCGASDFYAPHHHFSFLIQRAACPKNQLTHDFPSTSSITRLSSFISIGFATWAFMPSAMAFALSSAKALAVMAMMGIFESLGSSRWRMRVVAL